AVDGMLYGALADNVHVKVKAYYDCNEDGPAAGGIVEGYKNDSCTGKAIATQDAAVPNARPTNYICGAVPTQGHAISALNTFQIIDSNTSLRPAQALVDGRPNILIDSLVNAVQPPALGKVPRIDHMGLVRDVLRLPGN